MTNRAPKPRDFVNFLKNSSQQKTEEFASIAWLCKAEVWDC